VLLPACIEWWTSIFYIDPPNMNPSNTTIAPQIPILAQSENKSRFLERLGISDQTEQGKHVYAMMKVRMPVGLHPLPLKVFL